MGLTVETLLGKYLAQYPIAFAYHLKPGSSNAFYNSSYSGDSYGGSGDIVEDILNGAGVTMYLEPTYTTSPGDGVGTKWKMAIKKESLTDNGLANAYVDGTYVRVEPVTSGSNIGGKITARFKNDTDLFGAGGEGSVAEISDVNVGVRVHTADNYGSTFDSNTNDSGTKRMPDYYVPSSVAHEGVNIINIAFDSDQTVAVGSYFELEINFGLTCTVT